MNGKSVCLALGQGGARSLAHIGVLQVFQEAEIPIQQISGTSAGAIVGAVFAETADAFETERRFRTLLASESYARSGFGRLKDYNANGVNFWEQISLRIKGMLAMSMAQSNLGILRNKYFLECLQILIKLVDGAVCCPVPVEHCGILGQDVIVAVHVASSIIPDYQLQNALDVVVRAEEINLWNLDLLKTARADIQIFPDTMDVGWNEVHRLDEMLDSGRKAAKAALPHVYDAIAAKKSRDVQQEVLHCEPLFQECRRRFFQKV